MNLLKYVEVFCGRVTAWDSGPGFFLLLEYHQSHLVLPFHTAYPLKSVMNGFVIDETGGMYSFIVAAFRIGKTLVLK